MLINGEYLKEKINLYNLNIFFRFAICLNYFNGYGIVEGALPHASQQGLLHPYKSYADITLFHFVIPPDLPRATWEFVAFMDDEKCPSRDVHIYLQHGSYPVMNADNSSFPESVYTGRTSLYSTKTTATYHGIIGHTRTNNKLDNIRSIVPVYSPIPGDWFVAAFLSNWDQKLTQQGIGHKCHYSLFAVVLWSTDTVVEVITPGIPLNIIAHRSFSYYKFFVSDGALQLTITISDCKLLVNSKKKNCLEFVSLRAKALPTLSNYSSRNSSSYSKLESDIDYIENIQENTTVILSEYLPHTDVYYYLLVSTNAQAKFKLLVNITECQKLDLKSGWTKFLNGGIIRRPLSFYNNTSYDNGIKTKWLLNTSNVINNVTDENDDLINDKKQNLKTCPHSFQLTRIQHSQDFSSTFLMQVDDIFISSLLLPDGDPVIIKLNILPFLDIGGSLNIAFMLDRMLMSYIPEFNIMHVKACIRKGRPPNILNSDTYLICPSDMSINVSTINQTTMDSTLIIPYPEPGPWYLALQATCESNGTRVQCLTEERGLDIDIRITPCVFSADPCGPKGECERHHHGLFTFSSCVCLAGYSGWGCSDGKNAKSTSTHLFGTFTLTLSNLFFLPAVFLAAKRQLFAESIIYLSTTVFSIIYHACDEPETNICIARYEVLQFCDFFSSILAFWVTLISLAKLPAKLTAAAHMTGVMLVAVGVEWDRTALVVFLVPLALGLIITISTWIYRSWKKHNSLVFEYNIILRLLPGLILSLIGLLLFAFVETEANYKYVHSVWHMLMGLALLFLLPKSNEDEERNNINMRTTCTTINLLDASSQELCDGNDYPVFVLTSQHM